MTTKSKDDAPAPVESMLEGPDPFDPATHKKRVRTTAVRTVQTAVSVKKPSKQTFVRAHTEELFHIDVAIYTQEAGSRASYLVMPGLEPLLDGLAIDVTLVWMIDNQGEHFLCPTRPDSDNAWSESLCELVSAAKTQWVRLKTGEGRYNYAVPLGDILAAPNWPTDMTPRELLKLAFKGRVIDKPDHPVIQKLRAGCANT